MATERYLTPDAVNPAVDSLLDCVSEDRDAMACLELASKHVVLPDASVSTLRSVLAREGYRYPQDAVEDAIFDLALDLFPASWAAGSERLRRRVQARLGEPGSLTHAEAIEELAYSSTIHLRELATLSLTRLEGQELIRVAWVFRRALVERGVRYAPEHFSDHIYTAVRSIFPHSPGARWNVDWASEVMEIALQHVAQRYVEVADLTAAKETEAEIVAAAEAEDRRRYRRAVREWAVAHLHAFEAAARHE